MRSKKEREQFLEELRRVSAKPRREDPNLLLMD